jgi:hypothetical protein
MTPGVRFRPPACTSWGAEMATHDVHAGAERNPIHRRNPMHGPPTPERNPMCRRNP